MAANSPRRVARPLLAERAPAAEGFRIGGDDYVVFSWAPAAATVDPDLTEAEADVVARIVGGASNRAIAAARGTSTRTVANQVASLLRKLGVASRFELIRRCAR